MSIPRSVAVALLSLTSLFLGCASSSGPAADSAAQKPVAPFKVTGKWAVGGPGKWDFVTADPATHHVYVPRTDHVLVLDDSTGSIVAQIPDTKGVHGVALAPELGRGYSSNGKANNVTVFDTSNFSVLGVVPAGVNPDFIFLEPVSGKILAFNGKSHDVTLFDAAVRFPTVPTTQTIPLDGKPELAVCDSQGVVFVNLEDKSELVKLDAKEGKLISRYPLAPGEEPTGLAFDAAHHRLFSACANKQVVVVDSDSGKVVTTVPIGDSPDGAEFDAELGLLFVPTGDGVLTIIHEDTPDSYSVVQTLQTQAGAKTMGIDRVHHRLYLATASFVSPAPGEPAKKKPEMVPDSFVILVVGQ